MKNKNYKYLVSYMFTNMQTIEPTNPVSDIAIVTPEKQYRVSGNGRMILNLTKMIETEKDILDVEEIIKEELSKTVENLISASLCSFNLLKG